MGKIARLTPELANQIAAGEVVERPAAVVKELVENAIDAGARRLRIHIELGGKKQVRVEDDAEGMDPDDARLAIERHATSKIRHAEDLAAILTLGFRGEALPSMASVSHFVLRTRARGRQSGTEIRVDGGVTAAITEVGAAEGTVVEVNDLFYNLPARRKFLKSDSAEAAQVSRVATQLALGNPGVGFVVTSGPRTMLECPPAASLRDRLFQLYGDRADLAEVRKSAGGITLTGYVAPLAEHGPIRGPQHVFVNGRIVKDRTIAHAIIDAYSVSSIKERSPEVHLFLEMAPDAVDVNVHPTKAEVRFRDQSLVHEVVRRGLMDALGQAPVPPVPLASLPMAPMPVSTGIPGILAGGTYPNRWMPREPAAGWSRVFDASGPLGGDVTALSAPAAPATVDGRPMIPLGQFRDTFIIAIDDEGVVIIDQHVAHERVLFERVMQQLTRGTVASQRLLVPVVIELSPGAHDALTVRTAELDRLGFELESFGGGSVRLTAVPALLTLSDCARTVGELADDLESLDRGASVQHALQRIAASVACHAAVKARDPLSFEKMAHILEELRETAYSTICPHGRPVMLRIGRREIERRFERI